jgi:hypothetical protein
VLVVERWILARLRNRRFFSLGELNQAIGELVTDLKRLIRDYFTGLVQELLAPRGLRADDTPKPEAKLSEDSALPAPTAIHFLGNVPSRGVLFQPYDGSNPHPPSQPVTIHPAPAPQW